MTVIPKRDRKAGKVWNTRSSRMMAKNTLESITGAFEWGGQ
jgi:hypothetical protein